MPRKNALQEAADLFRRGIATLTSAPQRLKERLSIPRLEDLERDYRKEIARISSGARQITPQALLRESARRGAFGPLPMAAHQITQRFPRTTIPLTYGATGALKGATWGRVTPKVALGQELPSPETFGRRATIPYAIGELAGSLPYFEYAFAKAAPLTGLFGKTATKAIPTGRGLVPIATRAGRGFGARAVPSRVLASAARGLGAGAILGGFEALAKPGTPKERLAHVPTEAATFGALEPAFALGMPLVALAGRKVIPGLSGPLKALAEKFGKNIPKEFISATEKAVNLVSRGEGIEAWKKSLSKGELGAIKKQYGKVESFWRATTKEIQPLGVSVKPTAETLTKIARRKVKPIIQEEKAFLKGLTKKEPILARVNTLVRQMREASEETVARARVSEGQIKAIRELRNTAKIKNKELIPVMEQLAGESSFARMTRKQADQIIKFLQPANWAKMEEAIGKVRAEQVGERVKMVSGKGFTTRYPQLEQQFGAIGVLNDISSRISNIAENIKAAPEVKETTGTIRGKVAGLLPEAPAAQATGIRENFHVHLRSILEATRSYEVQMKRALASVFRDLTPEEAIQVMKIQAGGPRKGAGAKVLERANYLQDVFDASLSIHNMLRRARGVKEIPRRKRYIAYVLEENLRRAAHLFDKVAFDKARKKTFREFEAGLFEQDPAKVIDIWSRSSADYLKKDLFSSLLKDRYDAVLGMGGQAASYAKQLVDYDIYNMTSLTDKLLRSETWVDKKIPEWIGKIPLVGEGLAYRKIPINKELGDVLLGTRLNKTLAEEIKKGHLLIPRIHLPNVTTAVHTIFYPAALAWNFGFAILNRTQPLSAIPFIGVENAIAARLKMYSLLLPWNKAERARYTKILEDGGHFYRRMAAGEMIQTYEGRQPVLRLVDKSLNFLAIATEHMNRLENALGAEKFIDAVSDKEGIKLAQAEKEAVMARFAGFINFMFGKGYAPMAQRGTIGRLLYTFQQYPLNQILDVYTQMYGQAMKDDGARAFWQTMRIEAGAGEKAAELFARLPDTSKANVYKIFLALSIPPAVMYALSGSWNVASRAFPGMPRIALGDMFTALNEWMEDPELNLDQLKKQIGSTFDPRVVQRLADAIDLSTTGIITTRTKGTPIYVGTEDPLLAPRVFAFGRQAIPQYEEAYPSSLLGRVAGELTGRGTPAREATRLTRERVKTREQTRTRAIQIIKETRGVKSNEEKRKIIERHITQLGEQWPDVKDKINDVLEEEEGGVTPLSRRMKVMNIKDRAGLIIDQASRIEDVEERREYLKTLQEQGLLTAGVKKEINLIIKEEGFKPKKGVIENIVDFVSEIFGGVPEVGAAEGMPAEEEIAQTRMAVVLGLLNQGLSPDQIIKLLLGEPDSDWTEKEINQYLGALGIKLPAPATGRAPVSVSGGGGKKIKTSKALLTAAGKMPSLVRFPKVASRGPLDIMGQLPSTEVKIPQLRAPTGVYPLRLPKIKPRLGVQMRRFI